MLCSRRRWSLWRWTGAERASTPQDPTPTSYPPQPQEPLDGARAAAVLLGQLMLGHGYPELRDQVGKPRPRRFAPPAGTLLGLDALPGGAPVARRAALQPRVFAMPSSRLVSGQQCDRAPNRSTVEACAAASRPSTPPYISHMERRRWKDRGSAPVRWSTCGGPHRGRGVGRRSPTAADSRRVPGGAPERSPINSPATSGLWPGPPAQQPTGRSRPRPGPSRHRRRLRAVGEASVCRT